MLISMLEFPVVQLTVSFTVWKIFNHDLWQLWPPQVLSPLPGSRVRILQILSIAPPAPLSWSPLRLLTRPLWGCRQGNTGRQGNTVNMQLDWTVQLYSIVQISVRIWVDVALSLWPLTGIASLQGIGIDFGCIWLLIQEAKLPTDVALQGLQYMG